MRSVPQPQRLLFIIPHAGAGSAAGRDLVRLLPTDWSAYGLVLPGRERRFAEPATWSFDETVATAAATLEEIAEQHPHAAVVGLGQCSGAWLMYAVLAHVAPRLGSRTKLMTAVSQVAWHLPRVHPDLPDSSADLWAQLVASGDAHQEVADDEDARDLLEPIIRADYAAVCAFPTTAEPLEVPLLVVVGADDDELTPSVAESWAGYGTRLEIAQVSGGHFPLRDDPAAVARAIVERVDPVPAW